MVTSSLKFLIGLALAAAVAWTAYAGSAVLAVAAVLILVCLVLFWARSSGSRLRTELLHDPAVSTLVFPPESKLQQPSR